MSNYFLFGSNSDTEDIEKDINSEERHMLAKKPTHEVIKILIESKYLYLHCYYKNKDNYEYISTFGPILK